jgi:acyl-CoA thioesterase
VTRKTGHQNARVREDGRHATDASSRPPLRVSTPERITPGPFSTSLGFRLVSADPGGAVIEALPGPDHVNGGGTVHGGYLAALLDSTTGWAVHASFPPGVAAPHTTLTVQYLRAAVEGRPLRCTGRCLRAGRRVAAAEAEITQDGAVVAKAMTTHARLNLQ